MSSIMNAVIEATIMMALVLLFAQALSFSRSIRDGSVRGSLQSKTQIQLNVHSQINLQNSDCHADRERRIQILETYKNHAYLTETNLLLAAARHATICPPSATTLEKVAFLFIARGDLPHERLWQRFFTGNEDRYSIYVHTQPGFEYPEASFFSGRQIPSIPVLRFSSTLVDAFKRLMAHALLDITDHSYNSWFVLVCEASIPIRSFDYVYNYLTKSTLSFVESFHPVDRYHSWETMPEFPSEDLRKGEFWMALTRKHAAMVVAESTLYFKFKSHCQIMCVHDEQYIQTFLATKDAGGIANRTVTYVDWTHLHTASPFTYDAVHVTPELIRKIQGRRVDTDGARHDTAADNTTISCTYNSQHKSAECFLFARKFAAGAAEALQSLPKSVLGY